MIAIGKLRQSIGYNATKENFILCHAKQHNEPHQIMSGCSRGLSAKATRLYLCEKSPELAPFQVVQIALIN